MLEEGQRHDRIGIFKNQGCRCGSDVEHLARHARDLGLHPKHSSTPPHPSLLLLGGVGPWLGMARKEQGDQRGARHDAWSPGGGARGSERWKDLRETGVTHRVPEGLDGLGTSRAAFLWHRLAVLLFRGHTRGVAGEVPP